MPRRNGTCRLPDVHYAQYSAVGTCHPHTHLLQEVLDGEAEAEAFQCFALGTSLAAAANEFKRRLIYVPVFLKWKIIRDK